MDQMPENYKRKSDLSLKTLDGSFEAETNWNTYIR